jgi:corrinoid protein of di/trimethylamine methyltransferase
MKMSNGGIIKKLCETVIAGDQESSKKIAQEILSSGVDPLQAIREGLLEGLRIMGGKWVDGEIYLPEMMDSVSAMKGAMNILKSKVAAKGLAELKLGTVVLGTVQGDIHDIGKNIVGTMLEVSGFEVHDLGVDVRSMKFVEKAQEVGADIIGMSALMATSMPFFEDVIGIMKDTGVREKYKVLVGGGPVTQLTADEMGADGYGKDAEEAVRVAKKLLGVK